MMARMDPKLLPDVMVFLEVVRAGSITRAAGRLNTVQSNVTARIKKLEQAVDTPLLKRHARGVKPTPAGEAMAAIALRMDAALDDVRFTFGKGAAERSAKHRIGAIETVLASHLPRMVTSFLKRYPRVDVSLGTGSSSSLLRQLKEGEIDAAFVSRAPGSAAFRERLAFRDELVLVASSRARPVAKPWLEAGPPLNILVQRLGCSYTERLLTYIGSEPRRSYRLLELGTLEGVLAFVEAGLGVAAMPRAFLSAAASKRKLALFELPPRVRELSTYLVMLPAAESSFAGNAFFDSMRA